MRLRKPCEHDLYDPHQLAQRELGDHRKRVWCPGGEFATEEEALAECSDADLQEEWVRRVTNGSGEGTVRISYIGPDQPPVYIDDDPYRHWGEDV